MRSGGLLGGELLVGVVFLLLSAGCGPATNSIPPLIPPLEKLNVLFIVVDTQGTEHVGTWNAGLNNTPTLDRLARSGTVFRQAFSAAPWTQPSIASLLTAQMPSRHGLVRLGLKLEPTAKTLAEELRDQGFATAAVVSHYLLKKKYGFTQGFDHYEKSSSGGEHAITSGEVTDAATRWLTNREPGAPFFLFVHYFDPHYSYLHHPKYDRTSSYAGSLEPGDEIWELRSKSADLSQGDIDYLVGLHREEISHVDAEIGRLLDAVEAIEPEVPSLIVYTSDHGEEFLRHGWLGHTRTLYDELLHVPLVISLPGILPPRVSDTLVSLVDVVPTLMSLLSNPPQKPAWDGISLRPLLEGGELVGERKEVFAEVSYEPRARHGPETAVKISHKTALIRNRFKLIHDLRAGSLELYDREVDPEELQPLPADHAALLEMRARLTHWEESRGTEFGSVVEMSEEELDKLRSLGYVR